MPATPNTRDRADNTALRAFVPLCVISCMMEAGALAAWMHGRAPVCLGLHGGALLLNAAFVWQQASRGKDLRWSALMLLMLGAAGPFGAGMCLLTCFLYGFNVKVAAPFMEWFASLFPEDAESLGKHVYERIRAGYERAPEQIAVEPFRDILAYGSFAQKQAALVKMTLHFRPQFVPLMRRALNDTDNAVRVQAATAIAKIERDYLQLAVKLEKEHARQPDNLIQLARFAAFCEGYADSGISDALGQQAYRAKAIALYNELQQKTGESPETDEALARLYGHTQEPERACFHFERALAARETPTPELLHSYAETLYRMQAYGRLRKLASRFKTDIPDPNTAALLASWADANRMAA
jgi:hypothetical protein